MKQFSPKLFLVLLIGLFLTFCSDPVKVGEDSNRITLVDTWISNAVDEDNDGYASYARLYFEVTSEDPSLLYAIVGYRFSSETDPTYYEYKTTVSFDVDGSRELYVSLGDDGYEIPMGCYDLTLQIFDDSDELAEEIITSISADNDGDLADICMETPEDDQPSVQVEFFNPLYTTIDISVSGYGSQSVDPDESVSFYITGGLSSISVYAQTSGKTGSGTQVGLLMVWEFTSDISGLEYKSIELTLSSVYMFLYVTNTGEVDINDFYVNVGLTDETFDDIIIYNTGIQYRIGYYKAYTNTIIHGYVPGHSTWDYIIWDNSTGNFIPFTQNQSVSLLNTLKKPEGGIEKQSVVKKLWKTKDGIKPEAILGEAIE